MPVPFVTLANPSRRKYRRTVARRVHRNPSRRRRTVTTVAVRRPSPPKMTPAMRKKISLAVRAANRRRSGIRSVARRTVAAVTTYRRRASGRSSAGAVSSLKSMFSMPMLTKAGGAVGASLATSWVLNRYSSSLPGYSNSYGKALYTLGIPVAGAFLLRKKAPALAEGMVIGGLVMAINQLFASQMASLVAAPATPATPVTPSATTTTLGVAGQLGGSRTYASYPGSARQVMTTVGKQDAFHQAW